MSTLDGSSPADATGAPEKGEHRDVGRLAEEVARTRAELGDTVDALSAKLDVRARAGQQVDVGRARARRAAVRTRESLTDQRGRPLPAVWIASGTTALTAVIALAVFLRTRR